MITIKTDSRYTAALDPQKLSLDNTSVDVGRARPGEVEFLTASGNEYFAIRRVLPQLCPTEHDAFAAANAGFTFCGYAARTIVMNWPFIAQRDAEFHRLERLKMDL